MSKQAWTILANALSPYVEYVTMILDGSRTRMTVADCRAKACELDPVDAGEWFRLCQSMSVDQQITIARETLRKEQCVARWLQATPDEDLDAAWAWLAESPDATELFASRGFISVGAEDLTRDQCYLRILGKRLTDCLDAEDDSSPDAALVLSALTRLAAVDSSIAVIWEQQPLSSWSSSCHRAVWRARSHVAPATSNAVSEGAAGGETVRLFTRAAHFPLLPARSRTALHSAEAAVIMIVPAW
jgi:hypothetical protein